MEDKTLYEMILEKLGVEEGERFKILSDDYNELLEKEVFHFYGGYLYDDDCEAISGILIQDLINGKATIEKLPWKPKVGEIIYFIGNSKGIIHEKLFNDIVSDLAMLKCEWFFKSYKEAEENKERVLKEMIEVLEQ